MEDPIVALAHPAGGQTGHHRITAARARAPPPPPGAPGPRPPAPGADPRSVWTNPPPACGRLPAGLPARARAASSLLSPELRVLQDRTEPSAATLRAGSRPAGRRYVRVHQRGAAGRTRDRIVRPLPQPLEQLRIAERDGGLQ